MPGHDFPCSTSCSDHALRVEIEVTPAVPVLAEPARIVGQIAIPDGEPKALLVCLPGGGMNRSYFDLPTPVGLPEASFVQALRAQGFAVAWIDPVGVGESTIPRDPYLLTADVMAAGNAAAVQHILNGMRTGTLSPAWPACPELRSIGVGHSFGGLMTIIQQAAQPIHAAIAVLGFHTGGQPRHIQEADRGLDAAYIRSHIVELSRARYPEPYVNLSPPPSKQAVSAAVAMQPLLMTSSFMSVTPHIVGPDAAMIDVPVFLAFGDADLYSAPHEAFATYPKSNDITLLVLPNTRHNHFIYPTRTHLFERFAGWAGLLDFCVA